MSESKSGAAKGAAKAKDPIPKERPSVKRLSDVELPVPVSDLDAGGKAVEFVVRAAWLRGTLEDTELSASGKDGWLKLRVSKSGTDVVLHGSLSVELQTPCARCLDPATFVVDKTVSFLAVPKSQLKKEAKQHDEDVEIAEEDDLIGYENDLLVLDDWLRDELLLESPMIPLCSEGCPGIVPLPQAASAPSTQEDKIGTDDSIDHEHIDHRLKPLLALRAKLKNSKQS
jgi:uncharacterized protein